MKLDNKIFLTKFVLRNLFVEELLRNFVNEILLTKTLFRKFVLK